MSEVKDMSLLEILGKNVDEQQLVKDLTAKYVSGFLGDIEAKIESGEIDPIKGTDLDKAAMLGAIATLKKLAGM